MPAADGVTKTVITGKKWGFLDGPGEIARFSFPEDVVVAPDGSYLVADNGNHRVRRVVDGTVSTIAGTGERGGTDGPGTVATFDYPQGIAVDWRGIIYITEPGAKRVRKIVPVGGGWVVGTVNTNRIGLPWSIAIDPVGHLVVTDFGRHQVVRVDSVTGAITVIAGDGESGFRDGRGDTARFMTPAGVAVDYHGNIFVTEFYGNRVRRISADGIVTTVVGTGVDGLAQLVHPRSIVVTTSGRRMGRGKLLVEDNNGAWLRQINTRPGYGVATIYRTRIRIGGIAIDRDGSLLIAEMGLHRICRVRGLGLSSPSALMWSRPIHRRFSAMAPAVGRFVTTVMLCAIRLDPAMRVVFETAHADWDPVNGVPRLPTEMWLAILSMIRPDEMLGA